MKKIFTLLVSLVFTVVVIAQVPQKMSYQSVIRNSGNQLVTSHAVGMRVSILQGSATGNAIYVETQTPTTNANGLVTIVIGSGNPVIGTFSGIDWTTGTYYIKTETDPLGGTSYTITGTSQLLSVPFAFHAKSAATANDAVKLYGDQTISGNKIFTGNTAVADPINPSDATNKAYVDAILDKVLLLQAEIGAKDIDGNYYKAVKIGSQVWMSENLKTTKYSDGTSIPYITDNSVWSTISTAGYCFYENAESNKDLFGILYNWCAVNYKNICPAGWHVPTVTEFTRLEEFLISNGYNYDGTTQQNRIAKSLASASGWSLSTTTGAIGNLDYPAKINSTGFTAVPGGQRGSGGAFQKKGDSGYWWSSSEDVSGGAWGRSLEYNFPYIGGFIINKRAGFSVRCVKD